MEPLLCFGKINIPDFRKVRDIYLRYFLPVTPLKVYHIYACYDGEVVRFNAVFCLQHFIV